MPDANPSGLWPLPTSHAFVIASVADQGRAVIAKADLDRGSHILTTTPTLSPLAHVILRPYRREVCAWCFKYDRGREWKIRDISTANVFCTTNCEAAWRRDNDEICTEAQQTIDLHIKSQAKRQEHENQITETTKLVTLQQISTSWKDAEILGKGVFAARTSANPTKRQRALLRQALEHVVDTDILVYSLSGVLAAYKSNLRNNVHCMGDTRTCLPALFELVPDDHVFFDNPMTPSPLRDYTSAYLILLSLLPVELQSFITPDLIINLASRAAHNAFSIRPEGTTDGEQSGEFLGWGVWPEASFFNHSCQPNVRKQREGRTWSFYIAEDGLSSVKAGHQLCITYLGGDERNLDVRERRYRLQEQWGFVCGCERCIAEAGGPTRVELVRA